MEHLKKLRHRNLQQSMPAQLALGFRFEHGITVPENCQSSAVYLEQPARLTTEYVDRTYGLDTIEREKLNLLGPYVLSEASLLIDHQLKASTNSLDIIDLLDL